MTRSTADEIEQLRDALKQLLTRVQLEMRAGRLPVGWADPTILKARNALKGEEA